MAHKYLNELGLKSTECCIFNSEDIEDDRIEQFREERSKYGFDSRETWSLDFTLVSWIYSHLKMFQDIGGKVVDLTFHTFNVPELIPIPESELKYSEGNNYPDKYYNIQTTTHTLDECISLVCEYLEDVLRDSDSVWGDEEASLRNMDKSKCAINIVAEILPALWW